jgi:RNA polymerase sigma-70 factor (ECF subfamily)
MTIEEYNKAVDLYADNLYRFILKSCKKDAMAQDVVQDAFEKLWIKLENVEGSKAKSYLFTTAYHTMLDIFKKEKRMTEMDASGEDKHSHSEQYTDVSEVLQDALSKLSDIQRSVLLLRDYEGYSYEEIGEVTGLSDSQVKVYIYRARLTMKNYLVKMENII